MQPLIDVNEGIRLCAGSRTLYLRMLARFKSDPTMARLEAALEAGLNLNDAGLCVLTALMACTEDTNVIRRGGMEAAQALSAQARQLDGRIQSAIAAGTICAEMEAVKKSLAAWDERMSEARVSPGGCADLLALTLLAHFMR